MYTTFRCHCHSPALRMYGEGADFLAQTEYAIVRRGWRVTYGAVSQPVNTQDPRRLNCASGSCTRCHQSALSMHRSSTPRWLIDWLIGRNIRETQTAKLVMLQTVIICVYMPSKQRYSILRRQQVLQCFGLRPPQSVVCDEILGQARRPKFWDIRPNFWTALQLLVSLRTQ